MLNKIGGGRLLKLPACLEQEFFSVYQHILASLVKLTQSQSTFR